MPKMRRFKKLLRLQAKADKHFFINSVRSSGKTDKDRDYAYEFSMETRLMIGKNNREGRKTRLGFKKNV